MKLGWILAFPILTKAELALCNALGVEPIGLTSSILIKVHRHSLADMGEQSRITGVMLNDGLIVIYPVRSVPLRCPFLTADAVRVQAKNERAFVLPFRL